MAGLYIVQGTHTYATSGKYDIHVLVEATPASPVAVASPVPPVIAIVAQWDSTAIVYPAGTLPPITA